MNLKNFYCFRCHACCRQAGYFRLGPEEPDAIAEFLQMGVRRFIDTFTRLTDDRTGLSLMEQGDGSCFFLTDQGCRIQPVKPAQCRDFPHRWRFSGFEKTCAWARSRTDGTRTIPDGTGTYALILLNRRAQTFTIGRLGTFIFPRGYYVYIGSAFGPGGLAARVGRHLRPHKPLRWHVDYLTTCLPVVRVWHTRHPEPQECTWAGHFQTLGGTSIVPGFGASDCRCSAHLLLFTTLPQVSAFRKLASPVPAQPRKMDLSRSPLYSDL